VVRIAERDFNQARDLFISAAFSQGPGLESAKKVKRNYIESEN
jgi:hypothetical protein